MWLFESTYNNMDDNTERKVSIEFDGQFFDSELECYSYAMTKAYGMKKDNELLGNLEFIAC